MTGVAAKIPPQKNQGGAQLADVPQRLCLMTHGCENCQARPAMDEHKNNIRIPFKAPFFKFAKHDTFTGISAPNINAEFVAHASNFTRVSTSSASLSLVYDCCFACTHSRTIYIA